MLPFGIFVKNTMEHVANRYLQVMKMETSYQEGFSIAK
jgi:hypothetical protein